MLQSNQIRSCLHHAEECAHRAKIEPDPNLARDFLNMERRWLNLALSHAFAERLEAFAEHNEKRRKSATSFAEKGKATAHNRARIEARLDALTCEIAALARKPHQALASAGWGNGEREGQRG